MVIFDKYPNLNVEIIVDGHPLTEYDYDEEESDTKTITKYIEAQSGKDYAVQCTLTRPMPSNSFLFNVYVDGKRARGAFAQQEVFQHKSIYQTLLRGATSIKDGKRYEQNFFFSELRTDDSDMHDVGEDLKNTLALTGVISVQVWDVHNLRPVEPAESGLQNTVNMDTVPEKALKGKALSHQSSYREARVSKWNTTSAYDYMDPQRNPFAVFNFLYRSRTALRSLCVIPRTPSPARLEDRPIEELTAEEARELLRRQRERDEAARKVKRERRDDSGNSADGDDDVSFVSSKRRHLADNEAEVIDLT